MASPLADRARSGGIAAIAQSELMGDVSGFEHAAKKSWQSFSTMKRFVCEASRLEYVSWRLWFMHKNKHTLTLTEDGAPKRVLLRRETSDHHSSDIADEDAEMEKEAEAEPDDGSSSTETEHEHQYVVQCVYCEMHTATLRCNGCCHDAYCVNCFKMIHKKGALATHTAVKAREFDGMRDLSLSRHSSTSTHKEQSVHGADKRSAVVEESEASASSSAKAKAWEIQMDLLLQRLMMNSIHNDTDISVHNIDNRDSLGTADSIASFQSDSDEPSPSKNGETDHSDQDEDWEQRTLLRNQSVVSAAAALADDEHPKRAMSFDSTVDNEHSTSSRRSHSASAPALFVPAKSRKKASICANCNGNHITIDCPLLESSLSMAQSGPLGSASTGMGSGGVDTVLRKCFTTIHNDNMSNSTHAFLGDEVSVRGGNHFGKNAWAQGRSHSGSPSTWSSFGMSSIVEGQSTEMDDSMPILPELASDHKWDAGSWLTSSLATELPHDVFETLRSTENDNSNAHNQHYTMQGWVYLKEPGMKWRKRFLSLYRNNLWEYLDDQSLSHPIGFVNLSEGSVHSHQRTTVEFTFKYYRNSSPNSPRQECWIQCDSEHDAVRWREQLAIANKLGTDDLFDLSPDSPTASVQRFELGKGRFSVVTRARRRGFTTKDVSTQDCALKIIDKNTFWDLVAHETEREDTVVREILTQSLLTVRSGGSYCPVIRLLSLFETRSTLVMELELMREGDLHEEIVSNAAVNETRASFLVASLVKAIEYCHLNGVAHRDVKLSNLALDYSLCPKGERYSVIKMADFGMAAFIQKDGMLKGRCGTPGFVAPEILTAGKGEAYPSTVDMFSAGVVAYTMLCGYEPFFGVNDEELIQMNKRVEYEFEEPEWSRISDEAKDLISLMMEKDPAQRITPQQALHHPFVRDASVKLESIHALATDACEVRLL